MPAIGSSCFIEHLVHNINPFVTRHSSMHTRTDGHCDYDEKCCGAHHVWIHTLVCTDFKWKATVNINDHMLTGKPEEECPGGDVLPKDLGDRNHCSCPVEPVKTTDDPWVADCDAVVMDRFKQVVFRGGKLERTCKWGKVCCDGDQLKLPRSEFELTCKPTHHSSTSTCIEGWPGDALCDAEWDKDTVVDNSACVSEPRLLEGKCYVE
jgi:hypothetical protein